jgi:hypothetical protein
LKQLTITHVVVASMTAVVLLVALDRSGELRGPRPAYVPPAKIAPAAVAVVDPDKGKPPPHNDTVADMPDGKGRDTTFYACTSCHGVALIKAQGLTRDLWDASLELMVSRHHMAPMKPEERAEVLDYLVEQFPPRRKGRSTENPFLK